MHPESNAADKRSFDRESRVLRYALAELDDVLVLLFVASELVAGLYLTALVSKGFDMRSKGNRPDLSPQIVCL